MMELMLKMLNMSLLSLWLSLWQSLWNRLFLKSRYQCQINTRPKFAKATKRNYSETTASSVTDATARIKEVAQLQVLALIFSVSECQYQDLETIPRLTSKIPASLQELKAQDLVHGLKAPDLVHGSQLVSKHEGTLCRSRARPSQRTQNMIQKALRNMKLEKWCLGREKKQLS
mmetsp:Transcript_80040/g.147249  ORF Transcript_80040/g.147249 Transcript_80040/m.147249 type:complete len:173 (+) Transcript_80040:390-908(+)